ncbi:MAG TPA: ComF family protein [Armatimonadota bacterium]
MSALIEAGNALLDLLYPPKCYLCGQVGEFVCEDCVAAWPRPEEPRCPRCGEPLPIGSCGWCRDGIAPLAAAAFPYAYAEGVREVVHLLKYRGKRRVAAPMSAAMVRTAWDTPAFRGVDAIVPVGLHPRRIRQRGFNQSEWLAEEMSVLMNVPLGMWSIRTRHTRPQVGLSALERKENMRGAFAATPEAAGRRILLVDDVSTTGATAREAARELRDAGAHWVGLITFARDL